VVALTVYMAICLTVKGNALTMPREDPEIISEITDIEIIAVNLSIRDLAILREKYGGDRWRKLKGKAYVLRKDGRAVLAEIHWYECHGIGRRDTKVKKELE
jgi:hypothetical protein